MGNAIARKDFPVLVESYITEFHEIEDLMSVERFAEAASLAVGLANRMLEDAQRVRLQRTQVQAVASTLKSTFAYQCRQAAGALKKRDLDAYAGLANRAQRTLKDISKLLVELKKKLAA